MAVDKTKKPRAVMDVSCPHCEALLRVRFWKQRQDDPEPPDYAVAADAEIVRQGKLFQEEKAEKVGRKKKED